MRRSGFESAVFLFHNGKKVHCAGAGLIVTVPGPFTTTKQYTYLATTKRVAETLPIRQWYWKSGEHRSVAISSPWLLHPAPAVDIAAVNLADQEQEVVHPYSIGKAAGRMGGASPWRDVQILDVIPGKSGITPLMRSAESVQIENGAMNVSLPIGKETAETEAFVVQVVGGAHGSPVFSDAEGSADLLGLFHGRFGADVAGLGAVIPIERVSELLYSPELIAERTRGEKLYASRQLMPCLNTWQMVMARCLTPDAEPQAMPADALAYKWHEDFSAKREKERELEDAYVEA